MQLGVFIPIGNNGWLISTTSPQYKPSFDLNRTIVEKAERFGFDFALSMIKLHGFGGPSRILGLQSGIVHADGGTGRGDQPHPAVRHLRRADHAAADRRAHGGDDRLHLAWPVRRQHHLRLAAPRIHADGHLAGRRALPPPLRLLRRIRHHHAASCGRPDAPISRATSSRWTIAAACRCRPRKSRSSAPRRATPAPRFAAQYADYNFCASGGVNEPTRSGGQRRPAGRGQRSETGRDCGALVLQMVIADETDAAAMAKWEHYKAGTDLEALAWRDAQAEDDPSSDPYSQATSAARRLGVDKLPTNQGVLVGSYASVARMLDEMATVPGVQGVMLTFDDFVIGMEQFGTRILPLMQCRNGVKKAA